MTVKIERNQKNPFQTKNTMMSRGFSETLDCENRLKRLKEFDAEQLRAVLTEVPSLQKKVRSAAERRLRTLEAK